MKTKIQNSESKNQTWSVVVSAPLKNIGQLG